MAGSSIGRTTDFESVGWRFEPSPASFTTCAAARVKPLLRNCSRVPGRVTTGAKSRRGCVAGSPARIEDRGRATLPQVQECIVEVDATTPRHAPRSGSDQWTRPEPTCWHRYQEAVGLTVAGWKTAKEELRRVGQGETRGNGQAGINAITVKKHVHPMESLVSRVEGRHSRCRSDGRRCDNETAFVRR